MAVPQIEILPHVYESQICLWKFFTAKFKMHVPEFGVNICFLVYIASADGVSSHGVVSGIPVQHWPATALLVLRSNS